jgi:hypothetical protein
MQNTGSRWRLNKGNYYDQAGIIFPLPEETHLEGKCVTSGHTQQVSLPESMPPTLAPAQL